MCLPWTVCQSPIIHVWYLDFLLSGGVVHLIESGEKDYRLSADDLYIKTLLTATKCLLPPFGFAVFTGAVRSWTCVWMLLPSKFSVFISYWTQSKRCQGCAFFRTTILNSIQRLLCKLPKVMLTHFNYFFCLNMNKVILVKVKLARNK